MMPARNKPTISGVMCRNEPISRHTSWRVGGPAEQFFRPANLDDLALFLSALDSETPVFWIGLGSNLLVRDGGLSGVVIAAAGLFNDLEDVGGHIVRAGTSLRCTRLARQCIRWGYGPSEFFAGIPGTLGGALAMNAGAHDCETWERVLAVRTIDRFGQIYERTPDEYEIGYRSVSGPSDEWFVAATLSFDPAVDPSMETLNSMLVRRKNTQPLGLPSCGSVFRNPPGDYAARLIESCGLKGCRIGEAQVSEKHANFFINLGDATALDVENLILHVQQTVLDATGIELITEVRVVGREAI